MAFWDDIEADLDWRETELASLKILYAGSTPIQRRSLLRSMLAMLYAHFQGFCVNSLVQFSKAISAERHALQDHIRPIILTSLGPKFNKVRSSDNEGVLAYFEQDLSSVLAAPPSFADDEFETSNLYPDVLEKLCNKLSVCCNALPAHRATITSLVRRRNGIAHGESADVKDLEDYQRLEAAAFDVMYDLALDLEKQFSQRMYLAASAAKTGATSSVPPSGALPVASGTTIP